MAYMCGICNRVYARSSHLRRHETSHRDIRPFKCTFCNKTFARSDVTRRHLQHCPRNGTSLPPPPAKPGRKRASCDQCARAKVVCDRDLPCESCLASSLTCTFSRLNMEDGMANPVSVVQEEDHESLPREEKMSIEFLLTYTNPTTSFMDIKQLPFYDSGNRSLSGSPHSANTPWSPSLSALDMSFSDFMYEIFEAPISYNSDDFALEDRISFLETPLMDPLQEQIDKILRELETFISTTHPLPSINQPEEPVLSQARRMITIPNIRMTIKAYFRYIHHNCPIVHQPSFDPGSVSTSLLLAIFVSGCTILQSELSALPAELAYTIEEYIFQHQALDIHHGCHDASPNLEALQAAIIVISIRAGNDHPGIQQRVRDCRFQRVINVLRHYSCFSSTSTTLRDLGDGSLDWPRFIQEESLARVVFMSFLFDVHFTIFFRAPSRLTIQEMASHLPCPDTIFMAENRNQFQLLLNTLTDPRPSLASLAQILMNDTTFSPSSDPRLQTLTVRDLFILIIALHAIIFSAQSTCTMNHVSTPLERAFDRWKILWDNMMSTATEDQVASAGFMRFAPQFCWLARMMMRPGEDLPLDRVNVWSRDYFNAYLQRAVRDQGS